MSKTTLTIISFLFLLLSCKTENKPENKEQYLRWVGDIEQDDNLDSPDFKICNGDEQILQYFNLGQGPVYPEEKSTLLETFKTEYKPVKGTKQNGLIRIRFIVNCEGKAGRFRILESDNDYNPKEFDKRIVARLLEITQKTDPWKIMYRNEVPVDYYFYLIFRINDGQIKEILP